MSDALDRALVEADALFDKAARARSPEQLLTGHNSWAAYGYRPTLDRQMMEYLAGWPYATVRTIAYRVARQPLYVGRKGLAATGRPGGKKMARKDTLPGYLKEVADDLELLPDHPLVQRLRQPNPFLDGTSLIRLTVFLLEMNGEAFWWDVENERGEDEIWLLPGSWLTPVHVDEKEEPSLFDHYLCRPWNTGEQFSIAGDEVLRINYPNPNNPLFGVLSPLMTQIKAVLADESIQESQKRVFDRGVFPGLALIAGRLPEVAGEEERLRPVLTRDQRNSLLAMIRQQYQGVTKAGEPLILDGLIQDAKKISNSPSEMDWLESGKTTKERITQGWGVNPISMGQVEGVNRASATIADEHLLANAVNPCICHLSHCMTEWFSWRYQDPDLVAYLEEARTHDPDAIRSDLELLGRAGAVRRNEMRAAFGYPALSREEGGEEFVQLAAGATRPAEPGKAA